MNMLSKKQCPSMLHTGLKFLCLYIACALPLTAWSHALAPSLLQLTEQNDGIALLWKTSSKYNGTPLSPKLPARCHMQKPPEHTKYHQSVVTKGFLDCGNKNNLIGDSISAANIEKAVATVVLRYQRLDGTVITQLLSQKSPSFVIPEQMSIWQVMQQYFSLGVDHLIFGYDHVLFVIALLLLIRRLKTLLWAVTFFTLGHSPTLVMSSLKVIVLPTAWIEIAIAASIVFMAREILYRTTALSWLERRAWLIPLLFGLLHGMGFASALSETGLPDNEIPAALLAFNVGLEAGQLLVVSAFLLLKWIASQLASSRQRDWSQTLQMPWAYGIGCVSAYWVIERSYGLFF